MFSSNFATIQQGFPRAQQSPLAGCGVSPLLLLTLPPEVARGKSVSQQFDKIVPYKMSSRTFM